LEKSLLKARPEEALCWRVPGVGLRRLLRSRGGREEEDLSIILHNPPPDSLLTAFDRLPLLQLPTG
jgi:hypothetical protein